VLKAMGDHLPDAPAAEDWPEDLAVTREDAANVRQALLELPEEQRQAVEMAFFDGLTHMEIAEKTSVPLGTIKTRIRLGLMKIRDQLRLIMDEETSEAGSSEERE
jgi:RNA polymerase sigma-70 factor, ECF subfamily